MTFRETKMVDHRGTDLFIGAKVAYNLSGEIAIGFITSFKAGGQDDKTYRHKKSRICIEQEHPRKGESVVTSPKNVMVLFEERDWQAIETAPKNCTEFIGFFSNGEAHIVALNEKGECYRELDAADAKWEMPIYWMPYPQQPKEWLDSLKKKRKKK